MTSNEEFAVMLAQARELRLLRAVAEAARVLHAKGPDVPAGWEPGDPACDPEWSALGAALSALDGSDR